MTRLISAHEDIIMSNMFVQTIFQNIISMFFIGSSAIGILAVLQDAFKEGGGLGVSLLLNGRGIGVFSLQTLLFVQ